MLKVIAPKPLSFASLVQQFFTEYLVAQRAVSPRTVACYRDALMLFLDFTSQRLKKAPTSLKLNDIQPNLILAFLDHLERQRHNAVRSRNLRLTALRAFLKFAGRRDVTSLHVVERALAVPMKRYPLAEMEDSTINSIDQNGLRNPPCAEDLDHPPKSVTVTFLMLPSPSFILKMNSGVSERAILLLMRPPIFTDSEFIRSIACAVFFSEVKLAIICISSRQIL